MMRKSAFKQNITGIVVSRLFSIDALGCLALKLGVLIKQMSLFFGSLSQRAAEYPWVLKQISAIKPGAAVLDVGCAESLLNHELTRRGFRVVGLDIRACRFKAKKTVFVRGSIQESGLCDRAFDVAIMVSTVEHIGLDVYGQLTLQNDGDLKAMDEIYRMLKPTGILVMSTPYIGANPFKVHSFERNYNREKLSALTRRFNVVDEDYFFAVHFGRRIFWERLSKEQIDRRRFDVPGIACLVLKKDLTAPSCGG